MKHIYATFSLLGSAPLLFGIGAGVVLTVLLVKAYSPGRNKGARRIDREAEFKEYQQQLFTRIIREFRPALNIISSISEETVRDPEGWLNKGMMMIQRNCQELLYQMDQIQELIKLQAGQPKSVNMIQGDIIPYIRYLTDAFQTYADVKGLHLNLELKTTSLHMDFDPEKIHYCFFNLMSNAVKYTPPGGEIWIEVSGSATTLEAPPRELETCQFVTSETSEWKAGALTIRIRDTGCGLPERALPGIFDRFQRYTNGDNKEEPSNNGNNLLNHPPAGLGIGLPLTVELVKQLNGRMGVHSQVGEGTEFVLCLPVTCKAPNSSLITNGDQEKAGIGSPAKYIFFGDEPEDGQPDLPLVLLIEDDPYVLQYLAFCLQDEFRLKMALNGLQGIAAARELIPDIVISDEVTPVVDGFTVVDLLKHDRRTSHIPVMLLTERNREESRLKGLECGADACLSKPFKRKELLVRIRNLVELCRNLQTHYDQSEQSRPPFRETLDDDFLRSVRQVIKEHCSNIDFGIAQLCEELHLSRPQLHRKLKALTNKSTSQVIRSVRMQKATGLLQDSTMNVSEVGYAVGYGNPSHFTQDFTKEFGLPPSAYRSVGKGNKN